MGTKTTSRTTQVLEEEIESLKQYIEACKNDKKMLSHDMDKLDRKIEMYQCHIDVITEDLNKIYPPAE